MLDIKILRDNPAEVEKKLRTKDSEISLDPLLVLDKELRASKTRSEELKSERNTASKQIGQLKRKGADADQDAIDAVMKNVSGIGDQIQQLDDQIRSLEARLNDGLGRLPNIPDSDIHISLDPEDNVVIKEIGEKPSFNFPFKNHLELNDKLNLFDFERGAKVTGAGWPIYRGMGARLEWALIQYMIDCHVTNGYTQWIPPLVVKEETVYGSGQLPKFANQQYKLTDTDHDFYLIPTAEVALNGLHGDEIIDEEQLPFRYCAYTPCFRREAGAAGSQERGLIRVHQFNKVEMFCFATPDQSSEIFDQMVTSAENILEGIGLHYRSMLLVTGDMSFPAVRMASGSGPLLRSFFSVKLHRFPGASQQDPLPQERRKATISPYTEWIRLSNIATDGCAARE
jgi:seryl-tRNA synthetase